MNFLDRVLGKFNLSWSGDYSKYYTDKVSQKSVEYPLADHKQREEKIAILRNSRCIVEHLPNKEWLEMSKAIEERMNCFVSLPYQICNCSYIGEYKAWTGYNWNNKRSLEIAINELNFYLSTIKDIPIAKKIIPTDYKINFNSICFDFAEHAKAGDLPRSYILYDPVRKNNKHSQYPLIAFFNTIRNGPDDNRGNNYFGELYYSINGELSKANITCIKHGVFSDVEFSVVGRTFLISRIKTTGADGKLFTLYDCVWDFTDNIDFSNDGVSYGKKKNSYN